MKFKHLIIIFLLGIGLSGVGALLKILSWPYGNELLAFSTIVQALAAIGFIVKLVAFKDKESILNH